MSGIFTNPKYFNYMGDMASSQFIREGHNTVKEKSRKKHRPGGGAPKSKPTGPPSAKRPTAKMERPTFKPGSPPSSVSRAKKRPSQPFTPSSAPADVDARKTVAKVAESKITWKEGKRGVRQARKEVRKQRGGVRRALKTGAEGEIAKRQAGLLEARTKRGAAISARGEAKGRTLAAHRRGRKNKRRKG